MIRAAATPQSFQRGRDYYASGAVSNTSIHSDLSPKGYIRLTGDCEGTQAPYYRVQVELDEAGIRSANCTCPYEYGGLCKHTVALLLTYVHHPKQFAVRLDPADLLADLDRNDLAALITRLLRERPEMYDWVEAAIAVPTPSSKSKKTRRKKVDIEVYRRQVIGILHSLDGMRASEAYWHVEGLAHQLRAVQETAVKFLDAGDPETALAILMAIVEEGGRSIEYIDDSDGFFGDYLNSLGQPLAEAILSLDMSAVEREKLLQQLEKLSRYLCDYGMDEGLELAIQAATSGWGGPHVTDEEPESAATRRAVRERAIDDEEEGDEDYEQDWGDEEAYDDEWRTRTAGDLTEAKLNVLRRQGRTDEYLAVCKKTGRHLRYALLLCDLKRTPEAITYAQKHLASASDAHEMAERLRELGQVAEAISMGERGLKLAGPKVRLGEWLGPIEEAQGRTRQALQAWLAAFPEHPTLAAYETLKRLAGKTWRDLQPQVMRMLRQSHDDMTLAKVLLSEQEWDEAIKVAERRDIWYTVIETVADAVIPHRPEWVVRISIKQAERLMVEAKSDRYPIAADWLKRAKKAYAQLGQAQQWQAYLQKVKEQYKRRPALQAQLRRLERKMQ